MSDTLLGPTSRRNFMRTALAMVSTAFQGPRPISPDLGQLSALARPLANAASSSTGLERLASFIEDIRLFARDRSPLRVSIGEFANNLHYKTSSETGIKGPIDNIIRRYKRLEALLPLEIREILGPERLGNVPFDSKQAPLGMDIFTRELVSLIHDSEKGLSKSRFLLRRVFDNLCKNDPRALDLLTGHLKNNPATNLLQEAYGRMYNSGDFSFAAIKDLLDPSLSDTVILNASDPDGYSSFVNLILGRMGPMKDQEYEQWEDLVDCELIVNTLRVIGEKGTKPEDFMKEFPRELLLHSVTLEHPLNEDLAQVLKFDTWLKKFAQKIGIPIPSHPQGPRPNKELDELFYRYLQLEQSLQKIEKKLHYDRLSPLELRKRLFILRKKNIELNTMLNEILEKGLDLPYSNTESSDMKISQTGSLVDKTKFENIYLIRANVQDLFNRINRSYELKSLLAWEGTLR